MGQAGDIPESTAAGLTILSLLLFGRERVGERQPRACPGRGSLCDQPHGLGTNHEPGHTCRGAGVAGKTTRIFLADGQPIRIFLAEISTWTGKVLVAPRSQLDQLSRREEVRRAGVYLLVGPDPDDPSRALASIGEGDNVLKWLLRRSWNEATGFWERIVVMAPPGATAVDIRDAA